VEFVRTVLPRSILVTLFCIFVAVPGVVALLLLPGKETAVALSTTEWESVAAAIESFITTSLKDRLDSNGDNVILGEGDNAANAPVLIDSIDTWSNWIPGTSIRISGGATKAATVANASAVATIVNNHRAAGFTDDMVIYCATGHVSSYDLMAYGAMAHAGYFGSPIPKVYALKFGRLGWGGSSAVPSWALPSYNAYNKPYTTIPRPTPTYASTPTVSSCTGITPTAELVRCIADATLGQTGAGDNPWDASSDLSYQPVDVRPTIDYYIADNSNFPYSYQVPFATLFNATGGTYDNLKKLDPGTSKALIFHGRTPHSSLMVAQGARMLGYNARALRYGIPLWNGGSPPGWQEKWTSSPGYALNTSGAPDTTAPSVSSVSVSSITATSAVVNRLADEPATMKIEYGTSPGVYTATVNDTVLNANKSVTLTGLSEYTTYYFRVTSYDGRANGTTTPEQSFTTADITPPTAGNLLPSGWVASTSPNLEADLADGGSGINSATASISLDGGAPLSGCTVSAAHISCPTTSLSEGPHSFSVSVSDNAGNSAAASGSFSVDITPPTAGNLLPSGWVASTSPNLEADLADGGSGINSATASISLDGGAPLSGCTVSAAHISCPTTSLSEGPHSFSVSVSDNAGNSAAASGSFSVDITPPTAGNLLPSGWVASTSPNLEADLADGGSGINSATASISLDGGAPLSGCTVSAAHISCPTTSLSEGPHSFSVSVSDNAGNSAAASGSFSVDITPPTAGNLLPSGNITDSKPLISADFLDSPGASGILADSIAIKLDGVELTSCNEINVPNGVHVDCQAPAINGGSHTVHADFLDNAGNKGITDWQFKLVRSYYFPWYDNNSSWGMNRDWVLAANLGNQPTMIEIYIGEIGAGATPVATLGPVNPGECVAWQAPAVIVNGPVRVVSTEGQTLSVSQRVLYKDSFNEIQGTTLIEMNSSAGAPWYDSKLVSGVTGNWVLVGNLELSGVDVSISIGASDMVNPATGAPVFSVPARAVIYPRFPEMIGGPVQVMCHNCGENSKLIVSQRVIYKNSFNEVVAAP